MKYRPIATTNLRVSEIGFGLWAISSGWWQKLNETEVIHLMHRALDLGITLFETADIYGFGYSEELVSKAFRKQRDEIIIATKVGYDIYGTSFHPTKRETPQDFSPAFIRYSTEQALRRLKTDRIDLLQLHDIGNSQVYDNALWETLKDLQKEGKILAYGAALGPSPGWLYEGIDCIQLREPHVLQHHYNMLDSFPGRYFHAAAYKRLPEGKATAEELSTFCHGKEAIDPTINTGFLARVTHSSGLLEGGYTEGTVFPSEDPRSKRPRSWLLNGIRKISQLNFLIGKQTGRTLGQAALLWLLAEKTISSCFPAIYDQKQLEEFAQAPEKVPLTEDELDRVAELQKNNFGLREEFVSYAGTMTRE